MLETLALVIKVQQKKDTLELVHLMVVVNMVVKDIMMATIKKIKALIVELKTITLTPI